MLSIAKIALVSIIVMLAISPQAECSIRIGNSALYREVTWDSSGRGTVGLGGSGTNFLGHSGDEFRIELAEGVREISLTPNDFDLVKATAKKHTATINLHCRLKELPLTIQIDYATNPSTLSVSKTISILPCKLMNNVILRKIVIEDIFLAERFIPVSPIDRYEGNSSDKPKADTTNPNIRFNTERSSHFAAIDKKSNQGVFFFVSSLFGSESYDTDHHLIMSESMYSPLASGYRTAPASIHLAPADPNILYKRFREYLWNSYCVMRGKGMLVEYETWINERQHVSEQLCLTEMAAMKSEGYFNTFHVDYGWENHSPLTDDSEKFPSGLETLAAKAKSLGLDIAYWINPLGSKGQTTDKPTWGGKWDVLMKDHPDWFADYDPATNPHPAGNHKLSFTTPYADYVESKLLRLVKQCGARMFYIDGYDWRVYPTPASGKYSVPKDSAIYRVSERYQKMYSTLRKAKPDLIICYAQGFCKLPEDVHRLNTLDQIEFWDDTRQGCLGARQQRYNQMFIFPPYTMNSGWYMRDMSLPFPDVKYVAISALTDHPQIQGSQVVMKPDNELSAYLKRLFAFRNRNQKYFEVYQHILGFPDGQSVDGEAHIINNKGFILLFNPATEPRTITLPLLEPGLELKGRLRLSDWTELDQPAPLSTVGVDEKIDVTLEPFSAKIIGVNL